MADKKINLDFYAKVQTDVESVKGIVKNLKAQLEDLKLPAGATKNFEKSFEKLEGQIRDFESLASSGINSQADTKKVQAAWDKIAKSFSSLGFSLKELDTISDQIFPKEVSENIKKANKALENYQNKLKEIRETEKHKAKKQQISEQEKREILEKETAHQQKYDRIDKKAKNASSIVCIALQTLSVLAAIAVIIIFAVHCYQAFVAEQSWWPYVIIEVLSFLSIPTIFLSKKSIFYKWVCRLGDWVYSKVYSSLMNKNK